MQTPVAGLPTRKTGTSTSRSTTMHRRPTAVMLGNSTLKHAQTMRGESPYHQPVNTKEQVNHLKELELLRKELDRKDTRNASITQEMQALRNTHAKQERELRLLAGTFEKCNNERQRLANECSRSKEYIDRLELQLARLGNVQHLTEHLDQARNENEGLNVRLIEADHALKTRDDRIRALEKEVEVHERSLALQRDFEKRHGGKDGISGGSDSTLRSLYYELGKRQTDAHGLAVALAASNSDAQSLRDRVHTLGVQYADLQTEYNSLRQHSRTLVDQSVTTQDEISQLMERLAQMKAAATKFGEQAAQASKALDEERTQHQKQSAEFTVRENELQENLSNSQKECARLKARVESMQQSITHIENARIQVETRLQDEVKKQELEKGVYADKIRQGNEARKEVAALKLQVKDLILGREAATREQKNANALYESSETSMAELRNQLHDARSREQELLRDRESSVNALQQTIEATRTLSTRLNDEQALRETLSMKLRETEQRAEAAEKIAESLHRAREHVSAATLDALQKEKTKTAQLENQLQRLIQAAGKGVNHGIFTASNVSGGGSTSVDGYSAAAEFVPNFDTQFEAFASSLGGQDVFAPPLPPARRSADTVNVLRDSQSSLGSGSGNMASSSTASNVKEELSRMRQELNLMESANYAKRPQN